MAFQSSDEFDALPDPFEGVDFDQVPELCRVAAGNRGDDKSDDEAYFTDDIDPSDLDGVPHLGPVNVDPARSQPRSAPDVPSSSVPTLSQASEAAPPCAQPRVPLTYSVRNSEPHSQAASTQYFDEVDDQYLQQVAELERAATSGQLPNLALPEAHAARRPPTQNSGSRRQQSGGISSQPRSLKRKRSDVTSAPATPGKRSKFSRTKSKEATTDPHAFARAMLEKMEEEVTCAICYNILASSHITNPCGHSCCGDCLTNWFETAWPKMKCPICRAVLDKNRPVMPNVALDSVVGKHVSFLAEIGKVEWQPTGQRYQQLTERKRRSSTIPERLAELLSRPVPPASQVDGLYLEDDEYEDEDEDDSYASEAE